MSSTLEEIDQIIHGEEESEDTEVMTAADVINELEKLWLNEKLAPDLLPCHPEIVECVMEQLEQMQDNIDRAKKQDLKVSLHRMEIDRIRYVLSSYLRTRLHKIDKYANHILAKEATIENPCLSPEELKYAKEYSQNLLNHLEVLALKNMPQNLQTLKPHQKEIGPDLDSHVFLRANEDVEGILVEEETTEHAEEIVNMEKGDQFVVRYRTIAPLVEAGQLSLI